MNLHIENAKETFFNDKEHYLQFKAAWAKAVNNPDVQITASHHLVYNLVRGYDATRGFTPITNVNKLSNGAYINHGLYFARSNLARYIGDAKRGNKLSEWSKQWFDRFLAPLDGALTTEMLAKLDLAPRIEPLESNFSYGRKVAAKLIELKKDQLHLKLTFEDIEEILEEVKNESRAAA